jgi:hypothetical protein
MRLLTAVALRLAADAPDRHRGGDGVERARCGSSSATVDEAGITIVGQRILRLFSLR